jgi:4-hydroxy-2-oxoheptanedioate aldolase
MRENNLKKLWQDGKVALNAWLTIPSAWTGELMAHAGFDSVVIDMQHGLMDYQTTLAMLQAVSGTPVVPLVRVPWNEPASIMRMLDAGAYGIVCPMINNRREAEAFVQACRYPPLGERSWGPIRANIYAGEDYFTYANDTVLTLAMIETTQAVENLEEIAATPGLDGFYIGAIDLSISMGYPEKNDVNIPPYQAAVKKIVSVAKKHGLVTGIHVNQAGTLQLINSWGFDMLTITNDTNILRSSALGVVNRAKQDLGYS